MSRIRDIANLFSGNTDAATDAEVTTAISNHSSSTDPHGDRAAATSAVSTHAAAINGHVLRGTTTNRPLNPSLGDLYFDTTLNVLVAYTGSIWERVSQDPAPQIASISPLTAATTGTVVTISGSNFKSGITVQFIGTNSVAYNSPLATFVSGSTVTATTPALSVAYEPYDVKVINSDNQTATLENCLDVGGTPAWNTASGTIATINEQTALNVSVSATDPDGTSIVYSSSNLPSWISLNSSTGALTGTSPDISSDTTYSFDITASDGVNSSTRSFNVTSIYIPPLVVDFLVIAGGGGGGGNGGSGAGAGGYRTSYGSVSGGGSSAESPLTLTKGTNYSVTVGQGGASNGRSLGGYNHGVNGSNSVFHTITSIGGARGTGGNVSDTVASGGSGGGASIYNGNGAYTGGAGTENQGYAGGNATNLGTWFQSAGGGGAGGVGGAPSGTTNNIGGVGGAGLASSITGTSVIRASGGSGYSQTTATPGGGGADGGSGAANTGGGAGSYGTGGSGVVILRYPSVSGTINIGAGLTGSTSTVGSDKVTTITAGTGTVSWS